ncbi:hypothetical protein CY35_05G108500 [Sphagnum magellanicum]|nr:hypothetical protein CY35_05G108500 [Sphagnum magellanicum]KAH9563141.1 hypothetical protein CY35_05G108500 [Sphagnum magellanicum]
MDSHSMVYCILYCCDNWPIGASNSNQMVVSTCKCYITSILWLSKGQQCANGKLRKRLYTFVVDMQRKPILLKRGFRHCVF